MSNDPTHLAGAIILGAAVGLVALPVLILISLIASLKKVLTQ